MDKNGEMKSCSNYEITKAKLYQKHHGAAAATEQSCKRPVRRACTPVEDITFLLEFVHSPDAVQYRSKVTWHSRHETRTYRVSCLESRVSSQECIQIIHDSNKAITLRTKRSICWLRWRTDSFCHWRETPACVNHDRAAYLQVLPCANFTSDRRVNYHLVHVL